MESKYIKFTEVGITKSGKTKRFCLTSHTSDFALGYLMWHGPWRKYCFYPSANTLFDQKCLQDIVNFINHLMEERKK